MKKILICLAVALAASSTQAASISWALSNVAFGGSKLANAGNEFVASLFYLGSNGSLAASYSQSDIEGLDIVATSKTTTGKAANTGSYVLTVGTDKNNDVFGMLLSYTSEGKTYYNIATTTYKLSGFTDETSTPDKYNITTEDISYGTAAASVTKASPGGGWTAVPEPSTAALALAGLALLLKRRRA